MEEQACPTCGSCSGMFTANSMKLPQRGHRPSPAGATAPSSPRTNCAGSLFAAAGRKRIVEMAKAFYLEGNASVLPREHCELRGL